MAKPRATQAMRTVPWMLVELTEDIHTVLSLHNRGNYARYRRSDDALRRIVSIAEHWTRSMRDLLPQEELPNN